jgi:hypothetical protein
MITEDKLKIFERYDGNSDSWARNSSEKEKVVMTDDDWYIIESLIQDLFLVKNGLASLQFKDALNIKLKEKCDVEKTINQLKNLAEKK